MNTLLVMDSSVTPLQFLQRLRFPLFGSLTIILSPAAATTVWPFIPRASNTLFIRWMFNMCIRCQLASFSHILSKIGRTTTHWSYYPFFFTCFSMFTLKSMILFIMFRCTCVCVIHSAKYKITALAQLRTIILRTNILLRTFRNSVLMLCGTYSTYIIDAAPVLCLHTVILIG